MQRCLTDLLENRTRTVLDRLFVYVSSKCQTQAFRYIIFDFSAPKGRLRFNFPV